MKGLLRFYLSLSARLAVRFKRYDRALELYNEVERLTPTGANATAPIMAQGHVWGLKGDRARAKAEFQRALAIAPNEAVAHFNVGWVCDQQGLLDDALAHFEQAVKLSPKLDRAWYGIGIIAIKRGDHARAKKAFQEVVRIEPYNTHGWYQLGMTHYVLGESQELEGLKNHTLKFNPKIALMLDTDTEKLRLQSQAPAGGRDGAGSAVPA